ncbi:MAG: hypothetical protein AAFY60_17515, partial [Myxococcota bacterium]
IAILALATSACGGLGYQVDRDLLTEVSVENKLTLFDAENDVSIALDEREQIRREIQQVKQEIKDTDKQIQEAIEDAERAADKGDAEREKVAVMAEEVFYLKQDFLGEQIGLLRERLSVQESYIYVAFAKYELAKAKLVKKNNVRGAQDIDLEDFEAQVDEYVEKAKEMNLDFAEYEKEVEQVKQVWIARREQLQQASGGGLGSPWAEDSALWGF